MTDIAEMSAGMVVGRQPSDDGRQNITISWITLPAD
jgi:hypothetical protein